jgi:hypothetical protein
MTVFYHLRRGPLLAYYRCLGRKDLDVILHGECHSIAGNRIDEAVGNLLLEAVNPLALEVTFGRAARTGGPLGGDESSSPGSG